MPRKKSRSPRNEPAVPVTPEFYAPNDASWGGFINVTLTEADRDKFYEYLESGAIDPLTCLAELVDEGLKVGISYDFQDACYVLSMTGALLDVGGSRWCVTSRSPVLAECVILAFWKHFIFCERSYGDIYAVTGRKRTWG